MLRHIHWLKNSKSHLSDEKGMVLLYCMIVLLTLTTLGIVAHQASISEAKIAVNEQRWEEDFNISEGGAGVEASNVGFARDGAFEYFQITNPLKFNQFLRPPDGGTYDPGSDITIGGSFPSSFDALTDSNKAIDDRYWPRQNLTKNNADDLFDYAYLVTYVGASDKGLKGYDAGLFAAYKFTINSACKTSVEMGGIKIGVKPM